MNWISVKDRLPKDLSWMLVLEASTDCAIAYWTGERWSADRETPLGEVTHWMPLPEPPK